MNRRPALESGEGRGNAKTLDACIRRHDGS